jgi:hypothetical protein
MGSRGLCRVSYLIGISKLQSSKCATHVISNTRNTSDSDSDSKWVRVSCRDLVCSGIWIFDLPLLSDPVFSGILRLLLPLNHHNMRLRSFVVCISVVSATSLKGFGTHHVRLHFLIYRHLHWKTPWSYFLIRIILIRTQLTDYKLFPSGTNITSIPNSQPLAGVQFEGNVSHLLPLSQKARYVPDVSMMHQDGGNTGSTDYAGPTGRNLSVTSTEAPA